MKYDICLHTDTRKAFVGGYYTAVSLQHQILLSILYLHYLVANEHFWQSKFVLYSTQPLIT